MIRASTSAGISRSGRASTDRGALRSRGNGQLANDHLVKQQPQRLDTVGRNRCLPRQHVSRGEIELDPIAAVAAGGQKDLLGRQIARPQRPLGCRQQTETNLPGDPPGPRPGYRPLFFERATERSASGQLGRQIDMTIAGFAEIEKLEHVLVFQARHVVGLGQKSIERSRQRSPQRARRHARDRAPLGRQQQPHGDLAIEVEMLSGIQRQSTAQVQTLDNAVGPNDPPHQFIRVHRHHDTPTGVLCQKTRLRERGPGVGCEVWCTPGADCRIQAVADGPRPKTRLRGAISVHHKARR